MSEENTVNQEIIEETTAEADTAAANVGDTPPVEALAQDDDAGAVAKYYIPLEVGQELTGKIKTITDFGAFVDLNMTVDGLVHISEMSRHRVTKVSEVVEVGQEVAIWVKSVDRERGRIGLTMLKPVTLKYGQVSEGDVLTGKITRIESYGVFVDVGLPREGLIHVSELDHEYVKAPADVVSVDDELEVKVLKINARKKQVNLSRKALLEPPASVEEESPVVEEEPENAFDTSEEPMPTSMAVAFGLVDTGKKVSRKKQARRRKRNQSMDDVVARTLKNHRED